MYTKLFSQITDSTVWREPDHVRLVWITMLALADKRGEVMASVPGLSDRARVSLEQTVEALKILSGPDEWSRSKEHDGRRIEEVGGGWKLLNYEKYRRIRDDEERRAYMRDYMRKRRCKLDVNKNAKVSSSKPPLADMLAQAEAEAVNPSLPSPLKKGRAVNRSKSNGAENAKAGTCDKHPDSGLTNWGSCYQCYVEKYADKRSGTSQTGRNPAK